MSGDDDQKARKPASPRYSTGLMTGRLSDDPGPADAPGELPMSPTIALGPRMAEFVKHTPLDPEAKEQIEAAIANPALEEIRKQVVAVALINCINRRVTEHEEDIADLKRLRGMVETAAKGD